MKPKSLEIFIPGPAGRLEAKYYKNPKFGSPVAIVLHPHPQYGGTMNNRIVQLMYNIFFQNGFSVVNFGCRKSDVYLTVRRTFRRCRNFRLDRKTNLVTVNVGCLVFFWFFNMYAADNERTRVNNFITHLSQTYMIFHLAPCPTSGQVIYSENDELVTRESITELDNRIRVKKELK